MTDQPTRQIDVTVFTPTGWLRGALALPKEQSILAHFEEKVPFFKLTGVSLPMEGVPVPFLALRRDAALIVVPEASVRPHTGGETSERPVTCLLSQGVVSGNIDVLVQDRLSDYLLSHDGFLTVRDATIRTQGEDHVRGPFGMVILNAKSVVGVAELQKKK